MPVHQPKKNLRIGVFRGKQLLEERIVKKRQSVSFGQDDSATFCVLSSAFEKKLQLFTYDSKTESYTLCVNSSMRGRVIVQGKKSLKIEELSPATHGKDPDISFDGKNIKISLTHSSRGRIVIGKIAILFQFVGQSDKGVVGLSNYQHSSVIKLLEELIPPVLLFGFIVSLILHVGPLLFISLQDWPRDDETIVMPSWFKPTVVAEMEVEEEVVKDVDINDTGDEPSIEVVESDTTQAPVDSDDGSSKIQLMDRITDTHREQGAMITAQILGVDGGVDGFYADMLGSNAHIADMSDIAAGDIGAGGTGSLLNQLASNEGGDGQGIMKLGNGAGDGPKVVVDNAAATQVRKRVEFSVKEQSDFVSPPPAGSKESIERMFARRKNDISGCYQRVINAQGHTAGRFVIAITVSKDGVVLRVDKIEDQIGGEMFNCIRQRIMNWKFDNLNAPIAFKKTWVFS